MSHLQDHTEQLLRKYNLQAKKSLGQNFLIDRETLDCIVDAAEIAPGDTVVEIGPGLGILTGELCARAKKVIAIDMDPGMVSVLQNEFENDSHLEILHQDALRYTPPRDFKLIANIPYYLTGKILRHFLVECEDRPSRIVFLIQREVAERICARAGDHTLPSLLVQNFGEPKIKHLVAPGCFLPAPKVWSAVLEIRMDPAPKIGEIRAWLDFAEQVFRAKRKTLLNALHFTGDKKQVLELLERSQIDPQRRAQTLDFAEWGRLMANLAR